MGGGRRAPGLSGRAETGATNELTRRLPGGGLGSEYEKITAKARAHAWGTGVGRAGTLQALPNAPKPKRPTFLPVADQGPTGAEGNPKRSNGERRCWAVGLN